MSQATKTTSSKARRSLKKDNMNPFKDGFNWDKYLQMCNLSAAPKECFTQQQREKLLNKFQVENKIEAQDPRNPTSICLSTVVALQGPRIQIRLDGGDNCNDFWRLVDADDIYPLGTHEAEGTLLQPPLGYTKNMSTWSSFLAKNREKGERASAECFQQKPTPPDANMFEIGMKLEAVDRKNPDLICPATIGDLKTDQVFVSFDGWRGAMDYWCSYTSRDLFPVGWCEENEHPLSNPGNRGDNPSVVERLKVVAENAKRKTRSVAGSETEKLNKSESSMQGGNKDSMFMKSQRGRNRGRPARSLTPVMRSAAEKSERTSLSHISSVTGAESSADSDTCDSSASSHETSESSDGEEEATSNVDKKVSEDEKVDETDDSEIDESVVEVKQPTKREKSSSAERREKQKLKRKKKERKFLKMNKRRRHVSLDEDGHYEVKMKKRKKYERKHSSSSMYESPQKRILGFGNQTSNLNISTPSTKNIQSPSFLGQGDSPTTLFGFNRDIVKKATEGWPLRLMGSSKSVVTSDNKLARFGSQNTQENYDDTETKSENNYEVTTTTEIGSDIKDAEHRKSPDSPPADGLGNISSHTVSSTTNPVQTQDTPVKVDPMSAPPLEGHSLQKKRSRNPQRWSVSDVIDYVHETEPSLVPLVDLFQIHEIDGQALLLMNSSIAVKYMSMKLGPALKLSSLVEQLKKMVPKTKPQS